MAEPLAKFFLRALLCLILLALAVPPARAQGQEVTLTLVRGGDAYQQLPGPFTTPALPLPRPTSPVTQGRWRCKPRWTPWRRS